MNADAVKALATIAGLALSGGGLNTDCPTFENEEDALAHAKRIAHLKPGDEVSFKSEGKNPTRAIFLGPEGEGRRAVVLKFDDDQEVSSAAVPWGCLSI